MQLFNLGQIVATPGALRALEGAGVDPMSLVTMHVTGDYGALLEEDKLANAHAIKYRLRVLSRYEVAGDGLYVITEADRSSTTLLLVQEY